jgi:hypothetical protein
MKRAQVMERVCDLGGQRGYCGLNARQLVNCVSGLLKLWAPGGVATLVPGEDD